MKRILTVALAALALVLAACQREAPAPATPDANAAAAPATTDTTPVAATETTMAQAGVQPGPGAIDSKAFAGKFTGTLPCADCPGIDETLVLSTDGGFVLTDTYRERPGSANVVQGSWTLDADGKRIHLDPGSKDAVDKFYGIDGDGLRLLDGEGKPIDSRLPYRLKRDA